MTISLLAKVAAVSALLSFGNASFAALPLDTSDLLVCMGFDEAEFELGIVNGDIVITQWTSTEPQPTEGEILAARKPCYADAKRLEIDAEVALRSGTIVPGAQLSAGVLDYIEGFITGVLTGEATTPAGTWPTQWADTLELRNNRNTLLAGLEAWLLNPDRTAEQIRDFDIAGWSGWGVARP